LPGTTASRSATRRSGALLDGLPKDYDVLVFGGIREGALILKEMRARGVETLFACGDGCWDVKNFVVPAEGAATRARASACCPPRRRLGRVPGSADFAARYVKAYGPINNYAANSYDSARIVIAAIERGGDGDKGDAEQVPRFLAAMRQGKFQGIAYADPVGWTEKGDSTAAVVFVNIVEGDHFQEGSTRSVLTDGASPSAGDAAESGRLCWRASRPQRRSDLAADDRTDLTASRAGSLPLIGSELALRHSQYMHRRGGAHYVEHWRVPEHIVAWSRHAKVLYPRRCELVRWLLTEDSGVGEALLRRRSNCARYGLSDRQRSVAHGRRPEEADTSALAAAMPPASPALALPRSRGISSGSGAPADGAVEAISVRSPFGLTLLRGRCRPH